MNPYQSIFQALEDAKIQYIVVGGVAVNLHGYPRYTGDIDILLALDPENVRHMMRLMNEKGYVARIPVPLSDLANRDTVHRLAKEKGLLAYTFQSERLPQLDIDILVVHSLDFAKFDQHKVLVDTWNMTIPVASIEDIISMKQESNREQDLTDIQSLLELKAS